MALIPYLRTQKTHTLFPSHTHTLFLLPPLSVTHTQITVRTAADALIRCSQGLGGKKEEGCDVCVCACQVCVCITVCGTSQKDGSLHVYVHLHQKDTCRVVEGVVRKLCECVKMCVYAKERMCLCRVCVYAFVYVCACVYSPGLGGTHEEAGCVRVCV